MCHRGTEGGKVSFWHFGNLKSGYGRSEFDRQMLREEIGSASITPTIPAVQAVNTELTEEQKEENRRNVLQDLDDLFG